MLWVRSEHATGGVLPCAGASGRVRVSPLVSLNEAYIKLRVFTLDYVAERGFDDRELAEFAGAFDSTEPGPTPACAS
jgi:hypothetical protein